MMPMRNRGFSMLEVLVALVISLVTLMGAAGLVVRTVQQEVEAYQRIQALTLAQDIVDRIYSNRQVVACYSNGANGVQAGTSVLKGNLPACASGTASQRARSDADIDDWHDRLLGTGEVNSSGDSIGSMIGARGCITQVDAANRVYRVTVVWQGMSDTTTPASVCGQGQYTSEASRRAVSLLVQTGSLL